MFKTTACTVLAILALSGAAVADGHGCDSKKGKYETDKDIVEVAVGAGQFNTLAAALDAAGLVDVLKGDGPFTVFAPSDKAFAMLPEGTVANLLKPENIDQLRSVLTYHVVPGRITADKVVRLSDAETVNGQSVSIQLSGDAVLVDNARVVKTDIEASNGIIHVIDSVILPSS